MKWYWWVIIIFAAAGAIGVVCEGDASPPTYTELWENVMKSNTRAITRKQTLQNWFWLCADANDLSRHPSFSGDSPERKEFINGTLGMCRREGIPTTDAEWSRMSDNRKAQIAWANGMDVD